MASEQTAQNPDWFKTQQQYWDAWLQGQRQFFDTQAAAPGLSAQWDAFFREWQSMTTGAATPAADSYRAFFTQAGKGFLDLLEKFHQPGAPLAAEETVKTWMEQLQKFYSGLLQQNAQPFDIAGQFKAFTDCFTGNSPNWADAFRQAGKQAPLMFDPFGFYASMPGIGYTREKQDSLNHLYQLWTEYEAQMRRYNIEMAKVAIEALQKFQQYVTTPPDGAKPLESLKDIYIKFVDVSEDVFAKFAMSDEYVRLYGDVVNALTAFKKEQNKIADEALEQFGLPNRAEVDSLHKRVHELRRENQQLKKDIAEIKAALGIKAAAPHKAAAPAPKAKPAAKKKAAKKAGKK